MTKIWQNGAWVVFLLEDSDYLSKRFIAVAQWPEACQIARNLFLRENPKCEIKETPTNWEGFEGTHFYGKASLKPCSCSAAHSVKWLKHSLDERNSNPGWMLRSNGVASI